jgi:hypothetical protein
MEYTYEVENKFTSLTKIKVIHYKTFTIAITEFNDVKQFNNVPDPTIVAFNHNNDIEIEERCPHSSIAVGDKHKSESDCDGFQVYCVSKLIDEIEFDYPFLDKNEIKFDYPFPDENEIEFDYSFPNENERYF